MVRTDINQPELHTRRVEDLKGKIAEKYAELEALEARLAETEERYANRHKRLEELQAELQGYHEQRKLSANSGKINQLARLSDELAELAKQDPKLLEIAQRLRDETTA